jgi:hypothetical protein
MTSLKEASSHGEVLVDFVATHGSTQRLLVDEGIFDMSGMKSHCILS